MSVSSEVSEAAALAKAMNLGEKFVNVMEKAVAEAPKNALALEGQRIEGFKAVLSLVPEQDRKDLLLAMLSGLATATAAEAKAQGDAGIAAVGLLREFLGVVKELGSKALDVAKDGQVARATAEAMNGKVVHYHSPDDRN